MNVQLSGEAERNRWYVREHGGDEMLWECSGQAPLMGMGAWGLGCSDTPTTVGRE